MTPIQYKHGGFLGGGGRTPVASRSIPMWRQYWILHYHLTGYMYVVGRHSYPQPCLMPVQKQVLKNPKRVIQGFFFPLHADIHTRFILQKPNTHPTVHQTPGCYLNGYWWSFSSHFFPSMAQIFLFTQTTLTTKVL